MNDTPRTSEETVKMPMKPDAESPCGWVSVVRSSFAKQLERELTEANLKIARLEQTLSDIHVFAHCTSKAGPLAVPDLESAWPVFMKIAGMAANGLAALKSACDKISSPCGSYAPPFQPRAATAAVQLEILKVLKKKC